MIASIEELVAFLRRFHRNVLAIPSLDPTLIPSDLPSGLAMLYRELGALIEIKGGPFAAQDEIIPLSRLKRIDGMIEFARENQFCWSARCAAGQSDSPVYSNWDAKHFKELRCALNHFLITLCLQEAVMASANLALLETDRPPNQVLTVPLDPLWVDGQSVSEEPSHQFYLSHDQEVLVMEWGSLWVGSPFRKIEGLIASGIDFDLMD